MWDDELGTSEEEKRNGWQQIDVVVDELSLPFVSLHPSRLTRFEWHGSGIDKVTFDIIGLTVRSLTQLIRTRRAFLL